MGIDPDKKRIVQVLKDDEWVNIKMKDIKTGNVFRLYDPGGLPVKDEHGNTEFTARADGEEVDGVGIVEAEDMDKLEPRGDCLKCRTYTKNPEHNYFYCYIKGHCPV